MPLVRDYTPAAVSENIRREMAAGRPQKQAVAIALRVADDARVSAGLLPSRPRVGTSKSVRVKLQAPAPAQRRRAQTEGLWNALKTPERVSEIVAVPLTWPSKTRSVLMYHEAAQAAADRLLASGSFAELGVQLRERAAALLGKLTAIYETAVRAANAKKRRNMPAFERESRSLSDQIRDYAKERAKIASTLAKKRERTAKIRKKKASRATSR